MLLLDENISHRIIPQLTEAFPDCRHIKDISGPGSTDEELWNQAKNLNLVIVTFDSEYEEMVTLFGFPPKVIWLSFGNSSKETILKPLQFHSEVIFNFIKDGSLGILEINEPAS